MYTPFMGLYLETNSNVGKADYLKQHCEARSAYTYTYDDVSENGDDVLICVVHNGLFEAAGVLYSRSEYEAFNDPTDPRIKEWLIMSKAKVIEMNPNAEHYF